MPSAVHRFLDDVGQDVRYAMRTLGRAPLFTSVAVVCLALGIAANTAMFSVFDAIVLRPLPFAAPDRLVSIGLRTSGP
jgi:putative ABC transport system permease protein